MRAYGVYSPTQSSDLCVADECPLPDIQCHLYVTWHVYSYLEQHWQYTVRRRLVEWGGKVSSHFHNCGIHDSSVFYR